MNRYTCFTFRGKVLDEMDLVPDERGVQDDRRKGIETLQQRDNTTVEMAERAMNARNAMKELDMPYTRTIEGKPGDTPMSSQQRPRNDGYVEVFNVGIFR